MPKGISIHLGINYVDEVHYGSKFSLAYCVNDAMAMQYIAEQNGFESHLLTNEDATSLNLLHGIEHAAEVLTSNDMLLISFSGHGGPFKDLSGDESDGQDESLLLYDRHVLDDELYHLWRHFQEGVRILFISDSCYSGTITKDPTESSFSKLFRSSRRIKRNPSDDIYLRNKRLYDVKLAGIPARNDLPVECSVLLLSACQENELASAGRPSGSEMSLFTETLMTCWDKNTFNRPYKDFHAAICQELKHIKASQRPNYNLVGKKHPFFEQQIPFTI